MQTIEKELLQQLSERNIEVQHQIASLVHTEKCTLLEALKMTDTEIDSTFNEMRMELDS
ncbi:hypothetical protein OOT62_000824 [Listeria monocytogenes]|uniref:hypothetical protein n=1 Tax=Listeria monocytogenes TaxID=1639 RepID=UPI0015520DDF|nr:hypothetical protein [Listeria monocytogenes]EHL5044631.1 hypothetical protein [Listeria monocytogenes]EKB6589415.1 hypothetical protein [Listeria monocytogenes]EKY6206682.1 hypothetical protein [Listeria monocytogenes]ELU6142811.1 hypothetical protein [Listeria monocytogenes]HBD0721677.1 hypothetical protein [Listeria monocytogenes]